VSVTDGVRAEAVPAAGPPPDQRGGYERTPPQDLAAEQCVLGGMMLSKDAIADVVEILRTADFYRPAHATIFDTVLEMYGRGDPADMVTVASVLADAGNLQRIGGATYLHDLVSTVPTAANAAYYARIVAERAVLRRLVEAGTRIVQLGYGSAGGGGRDVDDVVDLAQQAVYDVTERRVSEDFAVLADMLQPTLDEIEAVGAQGGLMTGVPTGFTDLDRLLNGLHPGQLVVVAGRPGLGKALALDTLLATPDGWTTMGEVKVGARLVGADGVPTTVTATSPVMHDRPCYEVEFSDGTVIVADGSHRWLTHDRASRRQRGPALVHTTEEIAATLRTATADQRLNHSVTNCRPLSLPECDLLVPPYTLGVWLGDGHSAAARFSTDDPEIIVRVEQDGFDVRPSGPRVYPLTARLRSIGVLDDKHIPVTYLRSSEAQRRALLAGLLDADGTVAPTGNVQYRSTSRQLAQDVHELIVSLGYRCTTTAEKVRGRTAATSTAYTLNFSTMDDVFRLESKRLAHKQRRRSTNDARTGSRFVVDVRPVASVPVRCVTVDNADHLYLASRSMIPTHNSTASMDFARTASVRHNLASAIFSLEMSKVEIVMRLLSAESRVPLHVLRSGQLSDDDWTKLARRMGEISEAPLFVDDTPNMTLMEIRAKARRLKQRHDLKLIVVDYLQLMTSPKRVESRQQEVAELSRGLKLLAKEVDCPVVAVSQLNRGPEQRTDKRPQLSDLRESGCLTADTRVIRADTNEEVTLGTLLSGGARDTPVWALDERLKYVPRTMTHVFPSGRKEVFRLRLTSGKEIEATANHPFLTFEGWTPLARLSPGSRIAAPRHLPPPLQVAPWVDEEVILLAHLLGDGSFVPRQPIRYASRSHEKFLPPTLFGLPKSQVALFLRHLWATDGSVTITKGGDGGRIYLASTSRRMLEDVSRLLLRFGITGRLRTITPREHRGQYTLDISGRDDQLRFLREIGVHGQRATSCRQLLPLLEQLDSNPNVDTIPREVWARVSEILTDQGMSHRAYASATGMQFCGSTRWKYAPSRQRVARIAQVLDSADLELYATNDVFWDEVLEVTSVGEQDVFDATVLGVHNFVANGIAAHNSIEQDADVVILLHREDYYDKESPRAGEADFIVAKHRNGPTDTVTVAAQLHLSRFVDMAIV
jgi:replicative DNA helicase